MSDGPECFAENWTPKATYNVEHSRREDSVKYYERELTRLKEAFERDVAHMKTQLVEAKEKLAKFEQTYPDGVIPDGLLHTYKD